MNKKIVVGLSGGVDSSVSAALLLKKGYDVIGVTMKLWDNPDSTAVFDAENIAKKLGIPFFVIDYTKEFSNIVMDDFISEYKNGRTPNPCVVCNKKFKFGVMLDKAKELRADFVATGHYAKIEEIDGKYFLKRSADLKKDQTYFLYTLSQEQLSHIVMPLNDVTKEETRKIAEELGFSIANKKDSQEICFIPDGKYAGFIEKAIGKGKPGDFIDESGNVLGKHSGIINYTIGQRKGLGIALNKPVYVTKIDVLNNTVTLGDNNDLFKDTLFATNVNFIPFNKSEYKIRCTAKVRYSATDSPCTITKIDENNVKVVFDTPQRAITCGQSVVFYDNENCIGGGIIYA